MSQKESLSDKFMAACEAGDYKTVKSIGKKYKNSKDIHRHKFIYDTVLYDILCELCQPVYKKHITIITWILDFFKINGHIRTEEIDLCGGRYSAFFNPSPFEFACEHGNMEVAKLFREHTPPCSYRALEMANSNEKHRAYFEHCAALGRKSEEKLRKFMIKTADQISDLKTTGEPLFKEFTGNVNRQKGVSFSDYVINNYDMDCCGFYNACQNFNVEIADWLYSFGKVKFDKNFIIRMFNDYYETIDENQDNKDTMIKWLMTPL